MPIFALTNSSYYEEQSHPVKNRTNDELTQRNHWSSLGGIFEREMLEQPKAPDDVDYGIELTIK